MIKYHKIKTVYRRSEKTKKLIEGEFNDKIVEFLAENKWVWTEKVDGMNIQIHWDGHKVNIYGRTENAEIPKLLMDRLEDTFLGEENEQIFEQNFGEKEVILFGEGYGEKIQNGGGYINGQDFILFDVYFPQNNVWLETENISVVASYFNLNVVPIVGIGAIEDAVEYVKLKLKSQVGRCEAIMEGIVCKPLIELKDNQGNRIIVKIKHKDFD